MRPKTYNPKHGKGGGRQAMWAMLRRRGSATASDLVKASGSIDSSVRSYMYALKSHGYVEQDDDVYALVKNTGAKAPSVNMGAGTLHDWNLNPPMKPAALKAIWVRSGLSMDKFGEAIGMSGNQGTRLKQMLDGQRPISPAIEEKAKNYDDKP